VSRAIPECEREHQWDSDKFLARYTVLFFYPLDWTFVCPTEIVAFSEAMPKFKEIGCEVLHCPPFLLLKLR